MSNPEKRAIHNGIRLPYFRRKGRPSILSVEDANRLVEAINALLNVQIVPSSVNSATVTPGGTLLQYKPGTGSGGDGGSGSKEKLYTLVSHHGEYLVVTDGTTSYNVAKQGELRFTASSVEAIGTIDGVDYTATYAADAETTQKRVVSWDEGGGATEETQYIVPRYIVGDLIKVEDCENDTGVSGCALIESNDGRAWARQQEIYYGSVNLTSGQREFDVTISPVLPGTPKQIFLQVHGFIGFAVTEGSATTSGFHVVMSGAAPNSSSRIDFQIVV